MFSKHLLVTFRSTFGVSPSRTCVLRLQVPEGGEVPQVENFLSSAVAERVELRSRTTPDGVSFELVGTHGAILRCLCVDELLARTDEFSRGSLKAMIQDAAIEALENWRRSGYELALPGDRVWKLHHVASILGVLNVTPDSFSDGGESFDPKRAIEHGLRLVEDGADAIDVGGESTRPGASPVSVEEEIHRIAPVVAGLRGHTDVPISIDTSKAEVARVALDEGADVVNDVTALEGDPAMVPLLRDRVAPIVLMHRRGSPLTMQDDPRYDDVVAEIGLYLSRRLRELEASGIDPARTLVDPGIGFGKRSQHNLALIRDMNEFRSLGRPILMGLSRKSFFGDVLGRSVEDRETGTVVANTVCALGGAAVLRTHHVGHAREMKKVLEALKE